jgi:hypothetical protein
MILALSATCGFLSRVGLVDLDPRRAFLGVAGGASFTFTPGAVASVKYRCRLPFQSRLPSCVCGRVKRRLE